MQRPLAACWSQPLGCFEMKKNPLGQNSGEEEGVWGHGENFGLATLVVTAGTSVANRDVRRYPGDL